MFYYKKVSHNACLIAVLFCASCASPLHQPIKRIRITANKKIKVVSVEGELPASSIIKTRRHNADSQTTVLRQQYIAAKKQLKAVRKGGKIKSTYLVPRSNKPIVVALNIDSIQQTVDIKPRRTYGCYLNMKYVFRKKDSLDPYIYKNWTYPRKNVITVTDKTILVSRFEPVKKGTIAMTISAGIQILNLKRDTGRYYGVGIVGIEMGADYFYGVNRFLSFNIGAGIIAPIHLGDHFKVPSYDYNEKGGNIYTSVRNNMIKGNFDFGYGLSFSRLYWTAVPEDDSLNLPVRKIRTTGLGLSFSANYKLERNIKVGILYQPNLVNINRTPLFQYQHYITIHATWNFASGKSILKSNHTWHAR